jgi:saccharopine dehydrogenase (NAD+, L-lysine-forming)
MLTIGLIKEGKEPADNRVALTPSQCKWLHTTTANIKIIVQQSSQRCFADRDYESAGIEVVEDMRKCDIFLGIKEVPEEMLIPEKTYLFFSHTKKLQAHNQRLFRAILEKKITLIDYECLEHNDGQRILGFGFFAGIVGAHNGMMAYGKRTGLFQLGRIYENKNYRHLIHTYFKLNLPNVRIAVTGSGRVAQGVINILNLMGIQRVESDEYLERTFSYPIYVQLKGADLYTHKQTKTYKRENFHLDPKQYCNCFLPYARCTDILINGVYWNENIPPLFKLKDINTDFTIETIADIADDKHGSVPINIDSHPIDDPVYGIDRIKKEKTLPYLPGSIDIMAVANLPNELPRYASRCFGEQLIKHVLKDLLRGGSAIIDRATIVRKGIITEQYSYMNEYAGKRC